MKKGIIAVAIVAVIGLAITAACVLGGSAEDEGADVNEAV